MARFQRARDLGSRFLSAATSRETYRPIGTAVSSAYGKTLGKVHPIQFAKRRPKTAAALTLTALLAGAAAYKPARDLAFNTYRSGKQNVIDSSYNATGRWANWASRGNFGWGYDVAQERAKSQRAETPQAPYKGPARPTSAQPPTETYKVAPAQPEPAAPTVAQPGGPVYPAGAQSPEEQLNKLKEAYDNLMRRTINGESNLRGTEQMVRDAGERASKLESELGQTKVHEEGLMDYVANESIPTIEAQKRQIGELEARLAQAPVASGVAGAGQVPAGQSGAGAVPPIVVPAAGQPATGAPVAQAPAVPQVQYMEFSETVPNGFILEKRISDLYFGGKNLNDVARKVAAFNNMSPGTRLKEGDVVRIEVNYGNRREVVEYKAGKGEKTLRTLVTRVVRDRVNENADYNGFKVDNRAVVPVSSYDGLRAQGIDDLVYYPRNSDNPTHVLVVMADGERGDQIPGGAKVNYKGFMVEAPQVPSAPTQTQIPQGSLEQKANMVGPDGTTYAVMQDKATGQYQMTVTDKSGSSRTILYTPCPAAPASVTPATPSAAPDSTKPAEQKPNAPVTPPTVEKKQTRYEPASGARVLTYIAPNQNTLEQTAQTDYSSMMRRVAPEVIKRYSNAEMAVAQSNLPSYSSMMRRVAPEVIKRYSSPSILSARLAA